MFRYFRLRYQIYKSRKDINQIKKTLEEYAELTKRIENIKL